MNHGAIYILKYKKRPIYLYYHGSSRARKYKKSRAKISRIDLTSLVFTRVKIAVLFREEGDLL